MHSPFGWALLIFAGFWLFLAGRGVAKDFKGRGAKKVAVGVMGLFVLIGAGGFFTSALSAIGILKLPASVEWPAGYVSGVVQMADGGYVVPLVPCGRVQIYDSQWRFLRGWNVDAEGGDFKVESAPTGTIVVLTARGERRYSFTADGDLISNDALAQPYDSVPATGTMVRVPTSPLLWVFSSPFLSMGLAVIGFAGLAVVRKLPGGENVGNRQVGVPPPQSKVNVLIYPCLILAWAGFILVFFLHVAALAGWTEPFKHVGQFIVPGIFVIWLPTIVVMNRQTREFKQKDIWKAALRGCPVWMRAGLWILSGYGFVAALILPAVDGGMDSASNSARATSGIALAFYSIAACVLYSATRADRLDATRRCANGHPVAPLARYCEQCGAPVVTRSTATSPGQS